MNNKLLVGKTVELVKDLPETVKKGWLTIERTRKMNGKTVLVVGGHSTVQEAIKIQYPNRSSYGETYIHISDIILKKAKKIKPKKFDIENLIF
jgi:hypothetical protein